MKILVEGIDKSGKSSLIKELIKVFPSAKLFKNKVKPEKEKDSKLISGLYLGAYHLADSSSQFVIFDRSHITELVYSPKRGYDASKHFDWKSAEEDLLKNTILIYMTAPIEVLKTRFLKDNEEYIAQEEIEGLLERYDNYLKETKLTYLVLDSTRKMEKNMSDLITQLSYFKFKNNL